MTKKYKLLKWYPGLPESLKNKKDVFAEQQVFDGMYFIYLSPTKGSVSLAKRVVENNPEFWEEVVEKDYEILYYKHKHTEKCLNTYDVLRYEIEKCINDSWNIHSVKRLSDGEVFTIGDMIRSTTGAYSKVKIEYINTNSSSIIFNKLDEGIRLRHAEHVKPLFTTEDGIDIYKREEYWIVFSETFNIQHESNARLGCGRREDAYYFSNRHDADKWLEENKPKYSKSDIRDAIMSFKTDSNELFPLRTELFFNQLENGNHARKR